MDYNEEISKLVDATHPDMLGSDRVALMSEKPFSERLLTLIASANEGISTPRAVPTELAIDIARESMIGNILASREYRQLAALKEVNEYLKVAIHNAEFKINPRNARFLPLGHPKNLNTYDLSEQEVLVASASWKAADPSVPQELQPLVASALQTPKGSIERNYVASRLESYKKDGTPVSVILELI